MDKKITMERKSKALGALVVAASLLVGGTAWATPVSSTTASSENATTVAAVAPTMIPTHKFDKMLSPYGSWLEVEGIGRVWQPSAEEAGEDFVPYLTGGRWVETTMGRQFVSRWTWGLVVFHYGRWSNEPEHGWVWAADPIWAASWVDWRVTDEAIGWSPIPPGPTGCGAPDTWVFVPRERVHESSLELAVLSAEETARVVLTSPSGLRIGRDEGRCPGAQRPTIGSSGAPGSTGGFALMFTGASPVQALQAPAPARERSAEPIVRERAVMPERDEQPRPIPDVRFEPRARIPQPSLPREPMPRPWR